MLLHNKLVSKQKLILIKEKLLGGILIFMFLILSNDKYRLFEFWKNYFNKKTILIKLGVIN